MAVLPVTLPPTIAKLRHAGAYQVHVPTGEGIWGGAMLPDSLPILEDGMGDALLLRFGPHGRAREVVEWHHEGARWHPSDLVRGFAAPQDAKRRAAERALRSGLLAWCMRHGGEPLAETLGVPWTTLALGLEDSDVLDADLRARTVKAVGRPASKLFSQDWTLAGKMARAVRRAELAWPGAVIGRIAEKRGDVAGAIAAYRRSLDGFASTRAFTADWDLATRLKKLGARSQAHGPVALRRRWMAVGRAHLRGGRPSQAYDAFFRAGWSDFYSNDIDVVLDHLAKAAEAAGSIALAALARLHRASCA